MSVRSGHPVLYEILARLPWTIELAAPSMPWSPGRVSAAASFSVRDATAIRKLLTLAVISLGISCPGNWLGQM